MKEWSFILIIFFYGFLYGSDISYGQVIEDYKCWYNQRLQKIRSENPNRLWTFNNQEYLLNDLGQWMVVRSTPTSTQEYLQDLYSRGVCPKEHKGVYLDQSYYPYPGLYLCESQMRDGSRCPYHIDVQYPDGLPKRLGV